MSTLIPEMGWAASGQMSTPPGRTITVNEQGRAVNHPVRAAVVALDGNRLLVGTDVSERRRFTQRLRAMTFWGIGLTAALIAITGWWFSRRLAARVERRVRAQQRGRHAEQHIERNHDGHDK